METWKISNTSNQIVKVICKTNSMASKGIVLNPGEFCLSEAQLTATMDSQERRRFITVDREFDNSDLQLEYVHSYREDELSDWIKESEAKKSDFDKAAEDADKYINKD